MDKAGKTSRLDLAGRTVQVIDEFSGTDGGKRTGGKKELLGMTLCTLGNAVYSHIYIGPVLSLCFPESHFLLSERLQKLSCASVVLLLSILGPNHGGVDAYLCRIFIMLD